MYLTKQIRDRVSELTYLPKKDVELAILGYNEVILESLREDDGFLSMGYFKIFKKFCKPRKVVMSKQNRIVNVPAKYKIVIEPGVKMQEVLNELNGEV